MKRKVLISIVLLTLTCLLWASNAAQASQSAQAVPPFDTTAADEVVALINEWRIQQGLPPFRVNNTLIEMAKSQVAYIYPKINSISDDAGYHTDAAGRMPPARAAAPPFNWPSYGTNKGNVYVGENAAVGSPKFALTYWKGSSIHSRTALNPIYREIGAAAIKHPFGYVFIVNFGARPGILPTLIDSSGQTLYLTNDCFCAPKTQLLVTGVRLFDANGLPLTDPMPWQRTLSIPPGAQGPFMVLYTNGTNQYISRVDPVTDLLRIPGDSSLRGPGATLTSLAIAPTATYTPTMAPPSATSLFAPPVTSTSTPRASATSNGVAVVPTSTLAPRPSDIPSTVGPTATAITNPSLTLLYNSSSLIVYNASAKPINLTDLAIASDNGRIAISAWTAVAAFPVEAFPSGHCLVVQAPNTATLPTNACRYIRSAINISAARIFWSKAAFNVVRGTTVLATCRPQDARCDVRLPAN